MKNGIKFNVCGLNFKYFVPFFAVVMLCTYLGILPTAKVYSNDAGTYVATTFVATVAFLMCIGGLFFWLGNTIPIVNNYLGGACLLPLFGASLMNYLGLIPENLQNGCKVLMKTGFQDAYIALLLVGSVLVMDRNYYVVSAGSSLLNDDLTANLTSKEAIDGINFWLKVYKNCSPAETINYTVNDHATLFYQGKTAFDFNSGFMIGGVQNNTPEIAQYVRCAPLPRITDSDPIYSAEASHIPLVVWKNAKHPEICKAFIEYLYDTDNYVEFIHSVPVGMLPSLKDIATNSDYLNNDTIKEYSDCVDVIQTAVDEGHAIGFEHGPSAQASYLTSQGVIEEMFQDIITNGTDVETAAKAAEDKLNDIFDTMIS